MDQHDLGERTREIPEQPVAPLDLLISLAERIEQAVDCEREIRHIAVLAYAEPVADRSIRRYLDHFLAEPVNSLLQPTPGDHGNSSCDDCRRQQQRQHDQD